MQTTILIVLMILQIAITIYLVAIVLRNEKQKMEMKHLQEHIDALFSGMINTQRQQEQLIDRHLLAQEERMERFRIQVDARLSTAQNDQVDKLDKMRQTLDEKMDKQRVQLDTRLGSMQADNADKLEKMRQTVDEKLQKTLDEKLNQSFAQVSQRLEAVYRGLGEMQSLAVGVGDLKKVLTNVKTRGIWGEIQLGALLEQMLAPNQYEKNAKIRNTQERVDFAVRMPGRGQEEVLLPIDAKCPQEDYQRLLEAYDVGDPAQVLVCGKALAEAIKIQAKSIKEKYIDPPKTTDFAILYLPIEGLYAEVLRQGGLVEQLQRDHRVTIAGPTTLSALLTSLQMGFRTMAIEKRTAEVWQLLGAVKSDFGKFALVLEKTQRALLSASTSIEDATKKTRTIEGRLRSVQEMPEDQARDLLGSAAMPLFEEE